MGKMIQLLIFSVLLLIVTSACANKEDGENSKLALIKTTDPNPIELVEHPETDSIGHAIKKDIAKMHELYDVAVIQGKDEILVTYKVKHFQRFHMKKIEKEMDQFLEKKYPDEDFELSSDYKIFLETVRLKEKIDNDDISKEKAEKEFKDIIELKKEKT